MKQKNSRLAKILTDAGYEDVVLFENYSYEDAFVGISEDDRAIYSYNKMIAWLQEKEGFTYEDAVEWIDYNTIRALPYFDKAPIILYELEEWEERSEKPWRKNEG